MTQRPEIKTFQKGKTMIGGQNKKAAKDRLRKKIADSRKDTDINIAAHIKNCIVARRPPTNLRGVVPLILTHPQFTSLSPLVCFHKFK